jgi:hypothetical protein
VLDVEILDNVYCCDNLNNELLFCMNKTNYTCRKFFHERGECNKSLYPSFVHSLHVTMLEGE